MKDDNSEVKRGEVYIMEKVRFNARTCGEVGYCKLRDKVR